jgi:hypothetical protein
MHFHWTESFAHLYSLAKEEGIENGKSRVQHHTPIPCKKIKNTTPFHRAKSPGPFVLVSQSPNKKPFLSLSDVSGSAAAEEAMALAAALARAATRLLRGGLPPSAAYPALSSRSRQFCSLPADNEPSAPGGQGGGRGGDPPRRQARRELVKEILHSDRSVIGTSPCCSD